MKRYTLHIGFQFPFIMLYILRKEEKCIVVTGIDTPIQKICSPLLARDVKTSLMYLN